MIFTSKSSAAALRYYNKGTSINNKQTIQHKQVEWEVVFQGKKITINNNLKIKEIIDIS